MVNFFDLTPDEQDMVSGIIHAGYLDGYTLKGYRESLRVARDRYREKADYLDRILGEVKPDIELNNCMED